MPSSSAATLERRSGEAQVNVRMSAELKKAGDVVLAKAGITPSQAVRALWTYAAQHSDAPQKVASMLTSDNKTAEEEAAKREREERIARRRELAARGPKLMEETCKAMGIPWPPEPSSWTDEEWKEQAFIEQFGENWWEQ